MQSSLQSGSGKLNLEYMVVGKLLLPGEAKLDQLLLELSGVLQNQ